MKHFSYSLLGALSLLLVAGVLVFLLTRLWRCEIERSTPEGARLQQRFRQWRNRRAEEEMVLMLEELGWPKAVKKMTAEEVAHQLCNRLADLLWNRPTAGSSPNRLPKC